MFIRFSALCTLALLARVESYSSPASRTSRVLRGGAASQTRMLAVVRRAAT
jgi:hypothetical protein